MLKIITLFTENIIFDPKLRNDKQNKKQCTLFQIFSHFCTFSEHAFSFGQIYSNPTVLYHIQV